MDSRRKLQRALVLVLSLSMFLLLPQTGHATSDHEKLFRTSHDNWILSYRDTNGDGAHTSCEVMIADSLHDAEERIVPAKDMSCWVAAACNMLEQEGLDHGYQDWICGGIPAEDFGLNPWGGEQIPNSGDAYTFDDGGWTHWCLIAKGHPALQGGGPKVTSSPAGIWNENPIAWCQARISAGNAVGIGIRWGTWPAGGCVLGGGDRDGDAHAMTLWAIDAATGGATGTITVTDSDDQVSGTISYDYEWDGSNWRIEYFDDARPTFIMYLVAKADPVVPVEQASWGAIKSLYRTTEDNE